MLDPMWMQRGLEAVRETLAVDDATKRDMIQFLLDEGFWHRERLTWDGAVARWNACLNPAKPEFFKVCELWALMKRFRRYHLLHAMAEDLGFQPLQIKPSEERRQELLERIANTEEQLLAALTHDRAELAALDAPAPSVRVHPAFHDGHGSFSRPDKNVGGF